MFIKWRFLSSLSSLWEKKHWVVPWWSVSISSGSTGNNHAAAALGCDAACGCDSRAERQPRVLLLTAGRTWHCAPSSQQLSTSEIQGCLSLYIFFFPHAVTFKEENNILAPRHIKREQINVCSVAINLLVIVSYWSWERFYLPIFVWWDIKIEMLSDWNKTSSCQRGLLAALGQSKRQWGAA